ncbi:MAG: sel1 repeat family protein [Lentisphaeria bacterium]|nr:sel1 repeat family protein [Lentisphaeria bacterium]
MSKTVFLFILLLCMSALSGEMEQAKRYYVSRDYEQSYRIFRKLAVNGDPEAQLYISIFLYKRFVTDPAAPPFMDWLEKSSQKKYPSAMAILSLFYLEQGKRADGMKLMEEAAGLNSGLAQYYLGYFCLGYGGGKRNKKLAVEWLNKAVMNSDPTAKGLAGLLLGILYYKESDTPKDLKTALKYFQIAAEAKDPDAPFILFELFFNGETELPRDIEKAKEYFQLALKRNNTEALVLFGFWARKTGNLKLAANCFARVKKKQVDIQSVIKRYSDIINDRNFETVMASLTVNASDKSANGK